MNLEKLRAQMDELITELEGLRALDELNDEQEARAGELIAKVNELGPKIRQAEEAERMVSKHNEGKQSRGAVANVQPKGNGREQRKQDEDYVSFGQRMIDSEEFKAVQESGGRGVATIKLEQRDLVHTGVLPADYVEPMRIPGIQRPSDPFGSLRDVLTVGQTNSDALIYFRETSFTNNAAEVGEATATDGSTGRKPESALTFDQVTESVVTIAHWIPITKQTLWNAPELRSYIEGRLIDGLRMREDAQLLNGNGTGNNLTGLLNVTGVQALDDAYFTANPLANNGNNENFNRVLRARTLIATVGRASANFVVMNPMDHEVFMSTTDANHQYFGAGPFAAGNVPTLWGMRTVVNEHIDAGTVLVGDGRQATIFDRMQAQISVGTIDDQFVRNQLTILAENRLGLAVFRPQAFAVVELAEAEEVGE